MATVTVYTAARMQAIEDATIVSGSVDVSGDLILTANDSSTVNAGNVIGPQGPQGPTGEVTTAAMTAAIAAAHGTGAITETQLASGSVSETKIANGAVTETKISNSAVTSSKIAVGAIASADQIVDGIIDADLIATAAVTTGKIASGAVTSDKLGGLSVLAANIASSAVTETKLASNSVTSAKIASSAVTSSKIAAGTIGRSKLSSYFVPGTFAASNHTVTTSAYDILVQPLVSLSVNSVAMITATLDIEVYFGSTVSGDTIIGELYFGSTAIDGQMILKLPTFSSGNTFRTTLNRSWHVYTPAMSNDDIILKVRKVNNNTTVTVYGGASGHTTMDAFVLSP